MDEAQSFLRNAKCFELTIDNFNEVINEEEIVVELGEVCGYQWRAIIEKFAEEGADYLSINVEAFRSNNPFVIWPRAFSIEMAICVKNEKLDRWEMRQGEFKVERQEIIGWEKFMRMDTILDPGSEFLRDDGALVIQVEIRVDHLIYKDGSSPLNILDPFKGSIQIQVNSKVFHPFKRMLILHSPVLAEQLADGRGEVVIPDHHCADCPVFMFLQMIHGIKMEVAYYNIRYVLYLAHRYQVLTVLRQLEIQIKSCSDEYIRNVYISYREVWIKTLLGEKYHEELLRVNDTLKRPCPEKYKELIIRKRDILVAITRAPFSPEIDRDSPYIDDHSADFFFFNHFNFGC